MTVTVSVTVTVIMAIVCLVARHVVVAVMVLMACLIMAWLALGLGLCLQPARMETLFAIRSRYRWHCMGLMIDHLCR